MDLITTSWTCLPAAPRTSPPRLIPGCATSASATWKPSPAWRPSPASLPPCGGPVCADCGKALVTLVPIPPAELATPAGEVTGDEY